MTILTERVPVGTTKVTRHSTAALACAANDGANARVKATNAAHIARRGPLRLAAPSMSLHSICGGPGAGGQKSSPARDAGKTRAPRQKVHRTSPAAGRPLG